MVSRASGAFTPYYQRSFFRLPKPAPNPNTNPPARGRLAPLARPRESGWLGISALPRGFS